MSAMYKAIEQLDAFSRERDSMSAVILGEAESLQLDNKGRVLITERLKTFAGLNGQVLFVGKGSTFEIWNPQNFEDYYARAREYVISNQLVLRG